MACAALAHMAAVTLAGRLCRAVCIVTSELVNQGETGRLPEDSVMCKGIIKDKQIFNTMNKFRKYFEEIYNVYGK